MQELIHDESDSHLHGIGMNEINEFISHYLIASS